MTCAGGIDWPGVAEELLDDDLDVDDEPGARRPRASRPEARTGTPGPSGTPRASLNRPSRPRGTRRVPRSSSLPRRTRVIPDGAGPAGGGGGRSRRWRVSACSNADPRSSSPTRTNSSSPWWLADSIRRVRTRRRRGRRSWPGRRPGRRARDRPAFIAGRDPRGGPGLRRRGQDLACMRCRIERSSSTCLEGLSGFGPQCGQRGDIGGTWPTASNCTSRGTTWWSCRAAGPSGTPPGPRHALGCVAPSGSILAAGRYVPAVSAGTCPRAARWPSTRSSRSRFPGTAAVPAADDGADPASMRSACPWTAP